MGSKSVSSLWRFYLLGWHASGWDSRSYGSLAGSSQCGTPGPTNFGASHVMFLIFDDLWCPFLLLGSRASCVGRSRASCASWKHARTRSCSTFGSTAGSSCKGSWTAEPPNSLNQLLIFDVLVVVSICFSIRFYHFLSRKAYCGIVRRLRGDLACLAYCFQCGVSQWRPGDRVRVKPSLSSQGGKAGWACSTYTRQDNYCTFVSTGWHCGNGERRNWLCSCPAATLVGSAKSFETGCWVSDTAG